MNDNRPDHLETEKALYIVKDIERNPKVTQRELANKANVSLGKVNFLINALMDKGVIKVKNFKNSKNKLAYMYLLTPEGMKWKADLTYKFFQWKVQEYEKLKKEIELFKKEMSSASR